MCSICSQLQLRAAPGSSVQMCGARWDVLCYFLGVYRWMRHLLFWTVRAEELLDGIQDKIPTFQGLKFSDTDLLDFGQCVDQNRQQQFAFLFGVDEVSFPLAYPSRLVSLCNTWCSRLYSSIFSFLFFIKVNTLCLFLISNCWVLWWWEQLEQWAGKQDSFFPMLISVKSSTEAVITCAAVFLASTPFLIEIAFLCHILLVKRNELGLSTLLATQSLL